MTIHTWPRRGSSPLSAPAVVTAGQAPEEPYDLPTEVIGLKDWIGESRWNHAPVGLLADLPERELSLYGVTKWLDSSALLRWGDISQTSGCGCPLARVMRRELKKRGVQRQTVVYSVELPAKTTVGEAENGRHSPASCAYVPPAAGYLLASVGIRQLLGMIR